MSATTTRTAWDEALAAHAAVVAEHERIAAYLAARSDSGYLVARRSWLVSVALWHGMSDEGLTTGDALTAAALAYCHEHGIKVYPHVYPHVGLGPWARWHEAKMMPLPRDDFAAGLAVKVQMVAPCGDWLHMAGVWSPADLGEQLARHVAECAACRERRTA